MINKLDLFRSILFSVLIFLLIWDGFLWLTDPNHRLSDQHRIVFLTGFLTWFISISLNRNSDDDWAGQF